MKPASPPFGAFVIAGGRSTRMGRDKATAQVNGQSMAGLIVSNLRSIGLEPRFAGGREELATIASLLPDHYPGCGPLAGIEAGLSATGTDQNLFVGVDLPLISPRILRVLLERSGVTQAWATVPRVGGKPQPLCAVYHRSLLEPIRSALRDGRYKVMQVLSEAAGERAGRLDMPGMEAWMTACGERCAGTCWRDAFLNCNTPQELAEVEWKLRFATNEDTDSLQ